MILSNKQRFVLIVMVLTYFLITLYFWRKYRKEQFENNGKSLFFIHIPKNGGTSIEHSFQKSGIKLGRFDHRYPSNIKTPTLKNTPKGLQETDCSHYHVPPKHTDISFNDHIVFAVIRNPISRIVSEYNFSKGIYRNKYPVYESINDFVEFIYKKYKTDKFLLDCHILPQSEYLYDKNGKMCQNILCQENLQSDLSEFLKKYGFKDVKLSKNNTSSQQGINDLSPKSIRLINELYKDDIQLWEKSCGNFSTIPASPFPRRIFMYWAQGFDAAPKLVQECLKSWKRAHPKWQIDELDDSNLSNYIEIKFVSKEISLAAKSDVIRILLLQKYGGFWCDATLYCMKSIDTWLMPFLSGTEFFAFRNPGVDRMLSSWFLGAIPGSYITSEWANEVKKYWLSRTAPKQYFWFHYLFAEIYKNDPKFKRLWDQSHKLEANGPESPHSIFGFKSFWTGTLNPRFKEHVDSKRAPFYKLNHRKEIVKNGNLNYLVNNYIKPRRVAIVYRGFYKRNLDSPTNHWRRINDFDDDALQNHKKQIYDCFDVVDVFFHTYSMGSQTDKHLLSRFKKARIFPRKFIFEKTIHPNVSHSIIESLNLVEDISTYDAIINLRFDLKIKNPICNQNINYTKINLAFREPNFDNTKRVSDAIYIFPPKYKQALIKALENTKNHRLNRNGNGHQIYPQLMNNVSFIIDEYYPTNTKNPNPLFEISGWKEEVIKNI